MGPRPPPRSCDTFVLLPAAGSGLPVCFGKNSDRPSEEEHEVVHVPRQQHSEGSRVKCTHIEIPQARETLAVCLSKPRWLWGCEMGSNELGVVGGNEAVGTIAEGELGSEPRLLGMDLLRLALERGRTAREAVEVCAGLLEAHGQGGSCEEDGGDWTYENGFLFADAGEAFILETAGVSWWVAERVGPGSFRNISNGISVQTDVHSMHAGLKQHCRAKGWWDGTEPFDFKRVLSGYSQVPAHIQLQLGPRERCGRDFLRALHEDLSGGAVASGDALARRMMAILEDEESGICFRSLHGFTSTGSQVSLLPSPPDGGGAAGTATGGTHFFTCASDPKAAAYKRFDFGQAVDGAGEELGPRSLELWRLHRRRRLAREPLPDLAGIRAAALPGASGTPRATLLQLLDAEIGLFGKL